MKKSDFDFYDFILLDFSCASSCIHVPSETSIDKIKSIGFLCV